MTGGVRSTISAVNRAVVIAVSVNVRLPRRLPRISESCLSQPAWTTTPKRTEQNLIVRSGKSEAEVTNNRRLRLMHCTIEGSYRQTRSIARRLCDRRGVSATAELLVLFTRVGSGHRVAGSIATGSGRVSGQFV